MLKVLNLKEDFVSTDQALAMVEIEIERCAFDGCVAIKVLHGYGSHGKGGKILIALRQKLRQWKAIFKPEDSSVDHLHTVPLTNKEYASLYQALFPHYSKSKLPEDLISREHLANLRVVFKDPDLQKMKTLFQPGYSFAEFLIAELAAAYPNVEEWQG